MLLIILGILLLFVAAMLFVPLRYQGVGKIDNTVESLKAHLKFSWFIHLISGYVSYENKEIDWQVRILWKKVNIGEIQEETENTKSSRTNESKHDKEHGDESAKVEKIEDTIINKVVELEQVAPDTKEHSKKQSFFKQIKYTIRNICDKIKLLIEKKENLQSFMSNETHRASWNRVLQELVRFIRYIRPKKLVLNLRFGFEDPSVTGKVLAGLSMLYPFYAKQLNVTPDFEQKVLEGDIFINGTVRGIHALVIIWNLIFDKNIKKTYKEIQKWKG